MKVKYNIVFNLMTRQGRECPWTWCSSPRPATGRCVWGRGRGRAWRCWPMPSVRRPASRPFPTTASCRWVKFFFVATFLYVLYWPYLQAQFQTLPCHIAIGISSIHAPVSNVVQQEHQQCNELLLICALSLAILQITELHFSAQGAREFT